jgi:hypothetical protein
MNIIHVVKTLPRLVDDALAARLRVMPAVVCPLGHFRNKKACQ